MSLPIKPQAVAAQMVGDANNNTDCNNHSQITLNASEFSSSDGIAKFR